MAQRKIKIGVNALPLLSPLTGIGRYTYEICSRLDQHVDFSCLFYRGYYSNSLPNPMDAISNKAGLVLKNPLIKKIAKKTILNITGFFVKKHVDIYFEPNNIPIKVFKQKNIVTTLHDLSVFLYPKWHPKERVDFFNAYKKNILKSDVIVTVSHFIKNEIIDYFKLAESKVKVIYLGCKGSNLNTREKKNEKSDVPHFLLKDFILFVGSIEPRKNLKGVIKGYLGLPEELQKEFPLVIVGYQGWENKEIRNMIKKNSNIYYMGYVSDDFLSELYKKAILFIYPSFYEGFGLPPLEAMAHGCPVIVSNRASLPEVCGDAAYYVDPKDWESIKQGLYRVLTDSEIRTHLKEKGLSHAKKFSWDQCVREHIDLFKELKGN